MESRTREVNLVYIAGYGRSGSTLLDTLLSNHPDVFGAGELTWLFHGMTDNESCSCGLSLAECPFWQSVLDRVFDENPGLDCPSAAALTARAQSPWRRPGDRRAHGRLWRTTCLAISRQSGRSLIIDSSKSCRMAASRLGLLSRHLGLPVRALHLVRDPRAVMWSIRRGSNRRLEKGLTGSRPGGMPRGLLGWIAANLSVELTSRRNPALRLLPVRYEDLALSPEETFRSIGSFLGIDTRAILDRLAREETFDPGHGVIGNRMRRLGRIVVRFDDQWRTRLPNSARYLATIAWPLMSKYGYPQRKPTYESQAREPA